MDDETKRCFLGLRIPPLVELKETILTISNPMDVKLKIVEPKNYHFTLHFFGDITEDQIFNIKKNLEHFRFEPFELGLFGTGLLPKKNYKRVRVLYIKTQLGSDQLIELAQRIRIRLSDQNYAISKKEFLPHLTIARVKYGKDAEKLAHKWLELENEYFTNVSCSEFSLIKSTLTSEGPIYDDITLFPKKI